MEILNKMYLPKIDHPVEWKTLRNSAKGLIFNVFPLGIKVFWVGMTAIILLSLQVLIIGIADRLGISPKVSLIVSSLIYTTLLAGLAVIGGLKSKTVRKVVVNHYASQPICKMLIIKKKKQEVQL